MFKDATAAAQQPRETLSGDYFIKTLRDQEASGLSLFQYCRQRGIPYNRIANWRLKHQGPTRGRKRTESQFVPVDVRPNPVPVITATAPPVPSDIKEPPVPLDLPGPTVAIEVRLRHGRSIGVSRGFDAATLQRLLAVLEQATC